MSELQDLCKKLHPVIKRIGEGADFMVSSDGITWFDVDKALSALSFLGSCEFKEKPRTIKIGDFDVPEPMRAEPDVGREYFVVEALSDIPAASQIWNGMDCEKRWLSMGLCHKSKESAIAHAKAIISLTAAK